MEASDVIENRTFDEIAFKPLSTAVVHPCDLSSLEGAIRAAEARRQAAAIPKAA